MDATGLGDRHRLLPPTPDILEWYALADVLVSASDIKSMPRSMMEAMALGVPVLSAAVHGIPSLISDGVNGWLFAPRDMEALVEGMRRVLVLDDSARSAVGEAANSLRLRSSVRVAMDRRISGSSISWFSTCPRLRVTACGA